MTTFFALIFLVCASRVLTPFSMQPPSIPIAQRGSSHVAATPVHDIKGPAKPDTTTSADSLRFYPHPTRADSLEAGTVDPKNFTSSEFGHELERAQRIYRERKQYLDEINGFSEEPRPWT